VSSKVCCAVEAAGHGARVAGEHGRTPAGDSTPKGFQRKPGPGAPNFFLKKFAVETAVSPTLLVLRVWTGEGEKSQVESASTSGIN
jgi:hypothetical protein